mmetsp:Transcript_36090/g.61033  ORF Transcript_36090/g.61033 Transcript_36090/m.61033 type:complete len:1900 (+) Transcript_36090:65-5764(+)
MSPQGWTGVLVFFMAIGFVCSCSNPSGQCEADSRHQDIACVAGCNSLSLNVNQVVLSTCEFGGPNVANETCPSGWQFYESGAVKKCILLSSPPALNATLSEMKPCNQSCFLSEESVERICCSTAGVVSLPALTRLRIVSRATGIATATCPSNWDGTTTGCEKRIVLVNHTSLRICGPPTSSPTANPTNTPTLSPTVTPTASPTASPSDSPTATPTASPTSSPTPLPTTSPTASPSASPTSSPTVLPSTSPTSSPTGSPTSAPTSSPSIGPTTLRSTFPPPPLHVWDFRGCETGRPVLDSVGTMLRASPKRSGGIPFENASIEANLLCTDSGVEMNKQGKGLEEFMELDSWKLGTKNATFEVYAMYHNLSNYGSLMVFSNGYRTRDLYFGNQDESSSLCSGYESFPKTSVDTSWHFKTRKGVLNASIWFRIVVTFSEERVCFFSEGNLEVCFPHDAEHERISDWTPKYSLLGRSTQSARHLSRSYFNGTIGYVRFWDRALPPFQVKRMQVLPRGPTCNFFPSVTLPVSSLLSTIVVSEVVSLTASASIKPCLAGRSDFSLTNEWQQLSRKHSLGPAEIYLESLIEHTATVTANGTSLTIGAGELRMGGYYAFNFTSIMRQAVNMTNPRGKIETNHYEVARVQRTVVYHVKVQEVVAIIKGGASRNVSTYNGASYDISFDATNSFDPINATAGTKALSFTWSFRRIDQSDPGYSLTVLSSSPALAKFNTILLTAPAVYRVTVEVVALGTPLMSGAKRNATVTQTIYTSNAPVPSLRAELAKKMKQKPDVGKRLVLLAFCDNFQDDQLAYQWYAEGLNLEQRELLLTDTNRRALVVKPGALQQNTVYVFRIQATITATGAKSTASLKITTNTAPVNGTCSASPETGYSLQTVFVISCYGWLDTDRPLLYSFDSSQSEGFTTAMCPQQESEICSAKLPAPLGSSTSSSNSNLTITISVTDFYGAVSSPYRLQVKVKQRSLNVSSLATDADQKAARGDVNGVLALVSGTSRYLQTVNKTVVPLKERKRSRRKLLASIRALSSSSKSTTAAQAVTAPLQMIRDVTNVEDLAELTDESREIAMEVLSSVTGNPLNDFSVETVQTSVEALGNIAQSLSSAESTSQETRTNISSQIESIVVSLGSGLLTDSEEGEDAVEVVGEKIKVKAQKKTPEMMRGASVKMANGANARFPSDLPLPSSSQPVDLVLANIEDQIYPTPSASSSNYSTGSILVIQLKQGGGEVSVANLTTPVVFSVPSNFSVNAANSSVGCIYWDERLQKYSSAGVAVVGNYSGRVREINCSSRHLTAFSTEMRFEINVNTISASDVNDDAFSLNNTVMLVSAAIAAAYLLFLVITMIYDWHLHKQVGLEGQEQFWRNMNYHKRVRMEKNARSCRHFRDAACWGARRRHPWFAVFCRHAGDFITSAKRVTILVVLLFNTMTLCALLFDQSQRLPFLSEEFSISIVAMLMAIPVPSIIMLLFRRQYPADFRVPLQSSETISGVHGCFLICIGLWCGDVMIDDMGGGDEDGAIDEVANEEKNHEHENEEEEKRRNGSAAVGIGVGGVLGAGIAGTGMAKNSKKSGDMGSHVKRRKKKRDHEKKNSQLSLLLQKNQNERKSVPHSAQKKEKIKALRAEILGLEHSDSSHSDSIIEPGWEKVTAKNLKCHGWSVSEESEISQVDGHNFQLPGSTGPFLTDIRDAGNGKGGRSRKSKRLNQDLGLGFRADFNDGGALPTALMSNHVWTLQDKIGLVLSLIIVAGCWFLLSVLSWRLRGEMDDWVTATFHSMWQDIVFRFFQLTTLEALMFLPCCVLCCAAPLREKTGKIITFKSGYVGFRFFNLLVIEVDEDSPASSAGVQRNFRIISINGFEVESDKQARVRLHIAHRTLDEFEVEFEAAELKRATRISIK